MNDSPVIRLIAANRLCIGCGVCSAVCPRKNIEMTWNEQGYYTATQSGGSCPTTCDLCLRVCPFADSNANESIIAESIFGKQSKLQENSLVGNFRSCWVGYSSQVEQRLNGASGGLATWYLRQLLNDKLVDKVICTSPKLAPKPLFHYNICSTEQEIRQSAKSAYYPVHLAAALRTILETEGRYAVTCLPCYAKAIRLAAECIPRIRERLVCIIGLVCGHSVSSCFADYAAALAGKRSQPPSRVTFRTKNPQLPATELGTECTWPDGYVETVYWSEGPGEAWSGHWFTPNPCFYCDDIFAETADITFMDAWLPEYESDYRGTSLVIVRSELAQHLIEAGIASGEVKLDSCSPDDVARSQSGVVHYKREGLAHRLWLAKRRGIVVPEKRIQPRRVMNKEDEKRWNLEMKASAKGSVLWLKLQEPEAFTQRMRKYSWQQPQKGTGVTMMQVPRRILRKIKRMLRKQ